MRLSLILLFSLLLSASGWAQVMGYVDSVEVHRTDTIYFDFGSDVLDEQARKVVLDLAADRPGALDLYLEGHTDAVGSISANSALAQRRSENALATALEAGWPDTAVSIRHFGEQKLLVNSELRERRNRRVLLRSGLPRRYAIFRGRVVDEAGLPLPGGVIAASRYLKDTVRADDNGYYELALPLDIGVKLDIYANGYFYESETLVLREGKPLPPMVSVLQAAKAGSKVSIKNLYFVGNKTDLLKESFSVLPRLVQFMRSSPELEIEIAGHVNKSGPKRGPGSWFFSLATQRAKLIYDYLVKLGIPKERMTFKGYSNWEMVNPNARTEREMRLNRRVEIRVTKGVREAP